MTPPGSDPDTVFNIILVLHSQRLAVKLDEIPRVFLPVTGKWRMRSKLPTSVMYHGSKLIFTQICIKSFLMTKAIIGGMAKHTSFTGSTHLMAVR